jgi:hypothetical protein
MILNNPPSTARALLRSAASTSTEPAARRSTPNSKISTNRSVIPHRSLTRQTSEWSPEVLLKAKPPSFARYVTPASAVCGMPATSPGSPGQGHTTVHHPGPSLHDRPIPCLQDANPFHKKAGDRNDRLLGIYWVWGLHAKALQTLILQRWASLRRYSRNIAQVAVCTLKRAHRPGLGGDCGVRKHLCCSGQRRNGHGLGNRHTYFPFRS